MFFILKLLLEEGWVGECLFAHNQPTHLLQLLILEQCRSAQILEIFEKKLQHEAFVANSGFDTTEIGPSKLEQATTGAALPRVK